MRNKYIGVIKLKERIKSKLKEFVEISGVSGFEHHIVKEIASRLRGIVDQLEIDHAGNIYAYIFGSKPGLKLMIAAHSDQIGYVVKSIDNNGFIRFHGQGGVIPSLTIGRKVLVNGYLGIVGVKAGHIQKPEEKTKIAQMNELYIDLGVYNREEVLALGVNVGTPITYYDGIDEFADNDLVAGPGIDNRLGCAILFNLLEELLNPVNKAKIQGTICAVFTVQEEVGLRGAKIAAHKVNPDLAIALDTIPAGDTPETRTDVELPIYLGKGPVLPIISGGGVRGNIMHQSVHKNLERIAIKENIPYQTAIFIGGTSDASAIHLEQDGIPTGAITIPRRYSHSPVEMADLKDAEAAYQILFALSVDLPQKEDLSFIHLED